MIAPVARGDDLARVRLALRVEEAAHALGVSHDFFSSKIAPEIRLVRLGRVRLVPLTELERWLDRNAAFALDAC
jgi:excisionase family DNA binding protein